MTLQQLHQQLGNIQRCVSAFVRDLHRLDQIADSCGHPRQGDAAYLAQGIRRDLSMLFTKQHELEARLPTPELLSERAYNRALMLGFEVEAAEQERRSTYQAAAKPERKPYTKTKPSSFSHLLPTAFYA